MKKLLITQLSMLLLFTTLTLANLVGTSKPYYAKTKSSISYDPSYIFDGMAIMHAPSDNEFMYVRTSKTGRKGALTRDLVAGEKLKITFDATSSSTDTYIRSSQLNIPKTKFTQTGAPQKFIFYVKVSDTVTNNAFIGLYTPAAGESVGMFDLKIEETNHIVAAKRPFQPRTNGSMTYTGTSATMTAPSDYSYMYIRTSRTGSKGALYRDLVPGEQLRIKIRAKSSSTASYIRSSQLGIPKTRFSQEGVQDFIFNVTVSDDVTNRAYIGLYTTDTGESISVESIEILDADTAPPSITLNGSKTLNIALGGRYPEQGASAEDERDGDITANVVIGGDTVGTTTAGTYIVTYDVNDTAGNSAVQVTRTIIVGENPALTREALIQLISNWVNDPSQANADPIINANTSGITDMSGLFCGYEYLCKVIGGINDIPYMHYDMGANIVYVNGEDVQLNSMNLDISGWDVSNVTNMSYMFVATSFDDSTWMQSTFNQDISGWDVSNVTDMTSMFFGATSFNQDISGWDVSNVRSYDGVHFPFIYNESNYLRPNPLLPEYMPNFP